jgi:hypothetical protein
MQRILRLLRVAALALPIAVSASVPMLQGCGGGGDSSSCCKVCDVGKACGDTCIAATDTCRSSGGCACNK